MDLVDVFTVRLEQKRVMSSGILSPKVEAIPFLEA